MAATRAAMHRIRPHVFLIAAVLYGSLVPKPARACGDGGKAGATSFQTRWATGSWKDVLKSAHNEKEGVLLYFPPGLTSHKFFETKVPADLSHKRVFFRVGLRDHAKKKLRKEFEPNPKRHVIHLCDWFGNSIKSYTASGKAKFKGKTIQNALMKMGTLVKRLEKKLNKAATAAEKADEKGNIPAAIKAAQPLLAYKGYEAVRRARDVWDKILKLGKRYLKEAVALPDEEARTSRLKALARQFKGTPIESKARAALKDGSDGAKNASQSGAGAWLEAQ